VRVLYQNKEYKGKKYPGISWICIHGYALKLMWVEAINTAEAEELDVELDIDEARKAVYKMDYAEWKDNYQQEVSQEKLNEFNGFKK